MVERQAETERALLGSPMSNVQLTSMTLTGLSGQFSRFVNGPAHRSASIADNACTAAAPTAVSLKSLRCPRAGEFGINKGWVMTTGFATNILTTASSDDVGNIGPDRVALRMVFTATQQAAGYPPRMPPATALGRTAPGGALIGACRRCPLV
jgi:hypothetical protein